MGTIQTQAIKSSVYIYLGVIIGFVTSAIIFPKVLLSEQIGLLGVLVAYSLVFAQFAGLGWNIVTIKVFPSFRDKEKKHHGFLFLLLLVSVIGFALVMIVFYLVKPLLIENANDESGLFAQYVDFLIPLIFFSLLFNVFESYYRALFNAVIGSFLKEFVQRLLIFGSIILFIYNLIDFHTFVILYVTVICLPTVIIIISLAVDGELNLKPDFSFLNKKLIRHMISVGLFGIIGGFAGIVVYNVDRIMIERMIGLSETGIYATTFYFATLVVLPSRALIRITAPFVSESWNKNDLSMINLLYYKTSITQVAIGLLILAGLLGNIGNIFRILPPEYEAGLWVIVFIGLANLVDMSTGAAGVILANSQYYRIQTYFLLFLIILVIATNFIMIPKFGITGAAMASLFSKLIVNISRFTFLKIRFGLQPYNYRFLLILLAGIMSYLAGLLIPQMNLYLDILIRSSLITAVFAAIIFFTKAEPEWNEKFMALLRMDRKK